MPYVKSTTYTKSTGHGKALLPPEEVKQFRSMFLFISLYYGSDNKAEKATGIKVRGIMSHMKEGKLGLNNAKLILKHYDELKLK